MPTTATFILEPTNVDYLIPDLRLVYGDLTGSTFSDTIMRTALVNGVKFLQRRWVSKYQVYTETILTDPQPAAIAGYVYANTIDGQAYIPSGLAEGSVFRNPFVTFTQYSPPIIQSEDEVAIVLAAKLLLRRSQVASSASAFVSWKTEDISYSNLGSERSLTKLLESDQKELDDYFRSKIAKPQRSDFVVSYVPGLDDVQLTNN
jgi:hypothetical protein